MSRICRKIEVKYREVIAMGYSGNNLRLNVTVPPTQLERGLATLSLIALIGSFAYLCLQWADLPSAIPIHFNGKGNPDGWGSKWTLLILPAISWLLCAGLYKLSHYPHLYNYPVTITDKNVQVQYLLARKFLAWTNLELAILFGYFGWATVQTARGDASGMGIWSLPMILVVILGTLAVYLIRAIKLK